MMDICDVTKEVSDFGQPKKRTVNELDGSFSTPICVYKFRFVRSSNFFGMVSRVGHDQTWGGRNSDALQRFYPSGNLTVCY
jgi:hypothetical protein